MDWETLSSEYLYRDNWFTARKDRCVTPQGKIIDPYYVLEYPNWVNALALTANDEVLLIKQYRHAFGRTIIELPGGCVDDTDVSNEAAIRRELLEETGYTFTDITPLCEISPNPSTNTNICYSFLATGGVLTHPQSLDPNEEIDVLTVSIDELLQLVQQNQIWQALHVTTLFYGLQKIGKVKIGNWQ